MSPLPVEKIPLKESGSTIFATIKEAIAQFEGDPETD